MVMVHYLCNSINYKSIIMKLQDCIKSGQHLNSCDNDGFCNNCGHQENMFFYEIHVVGKNGFSTSIITEFEMDDDDIIIACYENDVLSGDDHLYIDYIQELSYDEWNTHFNFK